MIKKFLPKTLFFRYLLIIITPVIFLQIILTIVFFDSLWLKTNKGLVNSLSDEISTFINLYQNEKGDEEKKKILRLFKEYKPYNIKIKDGNISNKQEYSKFAFYDRLLKEELEKNLNYKFQFNTKIHKDFVKILVEYDDKIIDLLVPKSRIRNASGRIFLLWILVPAILLISISIIFLRNQIRPITNLASAAEKFGKGQYVVETKPSGAMEIRKAINEFEKMKKRILRHISQRTSMLSGISHDLKTPLTRLKLQIEILNKDGKLDKIKDDINEMQKMVSDYLDYSTSQSELSSNKFNLSVMLNEIMHKFSGSKIKLECKKNFFLIGRQHLIKRSILNIIENGLKYGNSVKIKVSDPQDKIVIIIDDDGPGIPEKEKERVLRPFYRLDKSRTASSGSVGLGLSIVQDIVNSHGGQIDLLDNPKGSGLRVNLTFPS
ncbi:MAG: two-component sensor histidine kinase [Candidatus Pelagibacter sp.]|nr:two-component sensor histidine kinase [Candidatus Pelagibacter sp.]OUV87684.1 MAG: two-component sensor histidine kinase [Pelagibacteraceae bacterium TMED136]|tara:strand:- start:793 stop:2094 length:1302 start_codon:yes stop_codon:yes gene_type:complete